MQTGALPSDSLVWCISRPMVESNPGNYGGGAFFEMGVDAGMGQVQEYPEGESASRGTVGAYGLVMRRYWWAIVLISVGATVVAFAISSAQPDRYTAEARITYVSAYTDTTQLSLELNGVETTLSTNVVRAKAASKMDHAMPAAADYTISAGPVTMSKSTTGVSLAPTRLVAVTAEAGSAALAADLANAYMVAFVQYRTDVARNSARRSIRIIKQQLAAFEKPGAQGAAPSSYQETTYLDLTQQLRQLQTTASTGTGGYIGVTKAEPPTARSSPQPARSATLGFCIGLIAAIFLTIVLCRFDSHVGGEREVIALLRLPVLGRLPRLRDERFEPGRLESLVAPASSAAEAYRRLRASISTVLAGDAVKTLLFASGREGEGTSFALANVAVAFARTGRRVVIVDADLRNPCLHRLFGLSNDEGVSSVVSGRTSLSAALQPVDFTMEGENEFGSRGAADRPVASLDVVTSGPRALDPGELVAGPGMAELLAELKSSADVVLVDTPGLLNAAAASSLASAVDGLVFLVDVSVTSRPALRECREYLDLMPCRQVGVVIMQQSRARSRSRQRDTTEAVAAESKTSESTALTASDIPGGSL